MKITLLAGGESHYQLGLLSGLIKESVFIEFIGNSELEKVGKDLFQYTNVDFLNLRGDTAFKAGLIQKSYRILKYYIRLTLYVLRTDSSLFHIQWENKFVFFDRTILILYYKILKKKIVYTAHNVNIYKRNNESSYLGFFSLWIMYHLVDHIIVHTNAMKDELSNEFNVPMERIDVISHGVNNIVKVNHISTKEARYRLGLGDKKKVLLFFGAIEEYKGLDILLHALKELVNQDQQYILIIAGPTWGKTKYLNEINSIIKSLKLESYILRNNNFIPDDEIEMYFMAADCLILPYRRIYQSGVLFLSYSFGIPVIASDTGSLREFISDNINGNIYRPNEPKSLSEKIVFYYDSDMYFNINETREKIKYDMIQKYSWDKIATNTLALYKRVLKI